MDICKLDSYTLPAGERHVTALGNFDGVHIAHSALLTETVKEAERLGATPAVFTFSKHSRELLGGAPMLITERDEKLELFEKFGIKRVFIADFENVRSLSPEVFVRDILVNSLGSVCAVCGYNFRFGNNGVGNADNLLSLMNGHAIIIPPINSGNIPVSSTRIREVVEAGNVEEATALLGRPFFISAPVIHGKALGRSIGVPTINQSFPPHHLVPARGVYACIVRVGDEDFKGVANVGTRPTVDERGDVNCETHIIGYSGDLYGECVKVSFYKKLRDEKRFDSVELLQEQIKLDIKAVNDYFGV